MYSSSPGRIARLMALSAPVSGGVDITGRTTSDVNAECVRILLRGHHNSSNIVAMVTPDKTET